MERDEERLNAKLSKRYDAEAAKLKHEIAAYYARFGKDNVVEYRILLERLSDDDRTLLMERMDDFARKHPQYAHLLPVRETIYRLNELEGLEYSILLQQYEIGAIEQEAVKAHLENQAVLSVNLAAEQLGLGSSFHTVNSSVVKATVGAAWAKGSSFSERIWGNKERLAAYLNEDFSRAIARGASYDEVVREIMERFEGVSKKDIKRLVFTEGTFVFNEASAQEFSSKFDFYRISTVKDAKVCKICKAVEASQEKRPMRYADRKPGMNFPPLHPWCRCVHVPHVPDWDAWIDERSRD